MIDLSLLIQSIPRDKSICVFSTHRTGSTALCRTLAKLTGLSNLNELFHLNCDPQFHLLYKSEQCIVKVHSNQIIEPYWSNIKSSFFVIGLYRRNLVEKIASAYIALQQQRYVSLVENIGEKYTVALDLEQITHVTRHVLELEAAYQLHSAGACQLELAYEDIVDQFVTSDTVPTVQPDNYDEITAAVMQQLEMSRMII